MKSSIGMDINSIRADFPALNQKVYGKDLVYLDNAATTHKPSAVLDKTVEFYSTINSNVHRGTHYLSAEASIAYEKAREKVKSFINAPRFGEIVFTKGTTESINLVASSFGRAFIQKGDEIITTEMEHHSNIVPWQILCEDKGAVLKFLSFDRKGRLRTEELKNLITKKTKLITLCHVSSVLGCVNPVKNIIETAHKENIPVLVDGAQSPQHISVDMQEMDCDFFAFSGHKMYAATGIGVLYAKKKWLEAMPPYQSGGGMVASVSLDKSSYQKAPLKFEAGTGNIAGALSLKAAIEYIERIGMEEIAAHEFELLKYTSEQLTQIDGITIYGDPEERCGVISFNLNNTHPEDTAVVLDKLGIAVRAGTHCAEPVMKNYNIPGAVRASLALYNTKQDVDKLIEGIKKAQLMLQDN
ncbi:MAG: aminotransferase class V-fold PLP-dependent enzyme [Elusimicrobiota bacterium]